jgi:hypothetical protein
MFLGRGGRCGDSGEFVTIDAKKRRFLQSHGYQRPVDLGRRRREGSNPSRSSAGCRTPRTRKFSSGNQWSAEPVRYPMSGHAQSRRSHGRGLPALTARLRWRVVASSGRHWPYGSRESRYIVQPYCAAPGVGLLFACCKPAKTDEPYKLQASSALKGSFRRQCHALPGHTSRR